MIKKAKNACELIIRISKGILPGGISVRRSVKAASGAQQRLIRSLIASRSVSFRALYNR